MLSDSCLLRRQNHGRTAVPAVRSFRPSGQARRLPYWFYNENRSIYKVQKRPKEITLVQGNVFSRLLKNYSTQAKACDYQIITYVAAPFRYVFCIMCSGDRSLRPLKI